MLTQLDPCYLPPHLFPLFHSLSTSDCEYGISIRSCIDDTLYEIAINTGNNEGPFPGFSVIVTHPSGATYKAQNYMEYVSVNGSAHGSTVDTMDRCGELLGEGEEREGNYYFKFDLFPTESEDPIGASLFLEDRLITAYILYRFTSIIEVKAELDKMRFVLSGFEDEKPRYFEIPEWGAVYTGVPYGDALSFILIYAKIFGNHLERLIKGGFDHWASSLKPGEIDPDNQYAYVDKFKAEQKLQGGQAVLTQQGIILPIPDNVGEIDAQLMTESDQILYASQAIDVPDHEFWGGEE